MINDVPIDAAERQSPLGSRPRATLVEADETCVRRLRDQRNGNDGALQQIYRRARGAK